MLDERDRPIASFLWPGYTADVTALLPVVARSRRRFGVDRACVVADRGMIRPRSGLMCREASAALSAATIAALEAQKIDYIPGARERSTNEVRETVRHDDGATVPLTIPRQKGETDLAVKEVKIQGRRYIVCPNDEEARKDAEARAKLLEGLQRKLATNRQEPGGQHRLPAVPGGVQWR